MDRQFSKGQIVNKYRKIIVIMEMDVNIWDSVSFWSEWLSLKQANSGEDVEKTEPLFADVGM